MFQADPTGINRTGTGRVSAESRRVGFSEHFSLKNIKLLWLWTLIDTWVWLHTFLYQKLKEEKWKWVTYGSSKVGLLILLYGPNFYGCSSSVVPKTIMTCGCRFVLPWVSASKVWWSCVASAFTRSVHVRLLPVVLPYSKFVQIKDTFSRIIYACSKKPYWFNQWAITEVRVVFEKDQKCEFVKPAVIWWMISLKK